jgi:hypothetical protein
MFDVVWSSQPFQDVFSPRPAPFSLFKWCCPGRAGPQPGQGHQKLSTDAMDHLAHADASRGTKRGRKSPGSHQVGLDRGSRDARDVLAAHEFGLDSAADRWQQPAPLRQRGDSSVFLRGPPAHLIAPQASHAAVNKLFPTNGWHPGVGGVGGGVLRVCAPLWGDLAPRRCGANPFATPRQFRHNAVYTPAFISSPSRSARRPPCARPWPPLRPS